MKPMPAGSAPEPRGLLVEFLARCYRPASGKFVLIAAALLFILLVGLMSRTSLAPRPLPGLTFLGYTNKPFTVVAALVLVTNGSGVPMKILPLTRSANVIETNGEYFHVPGYTSPWPEGMPRFVQPGQTTVLDIHLNSDFREPWWTEVATRPQLRPSRLRDYAASIRQPTLRRWAQRLCPPVETTWTKLGPFTNLPPGWVRLRDGSARRF